VPVRPGALLLAVVVAAFDALLAVPVPLRERAVADEAAVRVLVGARLLGHLLRADELGVGRAGVVAAPGRRDDGERQDDRSQSRARHARLVAPGAAEKSIRAGREAAEAAL